MTKFLIAAGHGGSDPGATSVYGIERDIAIGIVDTAFTLCAKQNLNGIQLVKVPHNLGLVDGINWINNNISSVAYDMCMEVHLNSNAGAAGTGTETYFGNALLAKEMNEEVVKVLGLANRGVKDGNVFMFNNSTDCASCLIEMGFVNNPTDVQSVVARGGLALAKGIVRVCGGIYKEPVVTPPTPPVTPPTPQPVSTYTEADRKRDDETNSLIKQIVAWFKKTFNIGG